MHISDTLYQDLCSIIHILYFFLMQVGRCLLAAREISPLEIILTDEPAVIGEDST